MKRTMHPSLIVAAVMLVLIAIAAAVAVGQQQQAREVAGSTAGAAAIRENSHRLDVAEDGKVTLVEFLDFECESCGAAYPYIEHLRQEYKGRITYAIRYFPLPGHGNAVNAALAVEAAAQQGELEPMYRRMFETQAAWGERGSQSQAHVFRGYAEELGLDMIRYDADVASPATLARVQSDFNEGRALGVQSTPTFFLNGKKLELSSFEDLVAQIENALNE